MPTHRTEEIPRSADPRSPAFGYGIPEDVNESAHLHRVLPSTDTKELIKRGDHQSSERLMSSGLRKLIDLRI
jgi:hypothetical protein